MPLRLAALLAALSCLLLAGPAAASERSEARQFAAAMQPDIALAPGEGEALIADYEARAAHVAATCLPSVRAAAKKPARTFLLGLVYGFHAAAASYERQAVWMAEGDDRLAAIAVRSSKLRRGRAARRALTAFIGGIKEAGPADFCAMVTAWEAKGFKGVPDEMERLFDSGSTTGGKRIQRAVKVLKRHGATRAQRVAFGGVANWPGFREPAHDPVAEALRMEDGVSGPWDED